ALGASLPFRLRWCILAGTRNAEIVELLARLERRREPPWFQPAPSPGFTGIFRIAVFRGDFSPCTTAAKGRLPARTARLETGEFPKLGFQGPALVGDLGPQNRFNLAAETDKRVDRHRFQIHIRAAPLKRFTPIISTRP